MPENDIAITIRNQVFWQIRREQPYMKTETLEKLLDSLTSNLRDSIEKQAQELEDPKVRANFFMLPAELRNTIYELVLVAAVPLQGGPPKLGQFSRILRWRTTGDTHEWIPLEILRTSRQVRQEALAVFLGANTFQVLLDCDDPEDMLQQFELENLRSWRNGIGKTQFAMIKHIDLHLELDIDDNLISRPRNHVSESSIILQRYAGAICKRAGATPGQLRADLPVEEWNVEVVKRCLPLEELGLGKVNVQLTVSASTVYY